MLGGSLASPAGRTNFRKMHPRKVKSKYCNSDASQDVLSFCMFLSTFLQTYQAEVSFCTCMCELNHTGKSMIQIQPTVQFQLGSDKHEDTPKGQDQNRAHQGHP